MTKNDLSNAFSITLTKRYILAHLAKTEGPQNTSDLQFHASKENIRELTGEETLRVASLEHGAAATLAEAMAKGLEELLKEEAICKVINGKRTRYNITEHGKSLIGKKNSGSQEEVASDKYSLLTDKWTDTIKNTRIHTADITLKPGKKGGWEIQ